MTSDAVVFEELLATFRGLGGLAENVRYGTGDRGRGLFPTDSSLPVGLHVPADVLVPVADLVIREGRLAVGEASPLRPDARALFAQLHEHFGWSAGLADELSATQKRWQQLPAGVAQFLAGLGTFNDPAARFAAASVPGCLAEYVRSRELAYNGATYVAPVLEFVNNSSAATPFVVASGVGVQGTFPGEILVRYSPADPWGYAMTYGFAENAPIAYSLPITVEPPGAPRLSIRRDLAAADVDARRNRLPKVTVRSDAVDLSFVMLGHSRQPDLPRGAFRKVTSGHVSSEKADEIFDSILRFNHLKFLALLKLLRAHDVPLTNVLQEAAIHQLEALSANVGARSL